MDSLPINISDLAIAVILLLSALLAFLRGFMAEVLSIVAWIGALAVATYGYVHLQPYARELITFNETVADLAAGVGLFVVSLVIFSILARVLSGSVSMAGLGALDKSLGFLFGLARGAVLVCIAYLLVVYAVPNEADRPSWLRDARALPLVSEGADFLYELIPVHLRGEADEAANRARQRAEYEAREALRRQLLAPTPKAGASSPSNGYTDGERQDMNRAIQSTQ
ncbi:MAG: CvpA family protein [Alphaproteobacteria bacterium]|nr:CvpA family protein [Alphaproteobacteria bacterium]